MHFSIPPVTLLSAIAGAALLAAPPDPAPTGSANQRVSYEGRLEVRLESVERYPYAGQPIDIRVTFRNPTGSFMSIQADLFDMARLKALDAEDKPLEMDPGAPVEVKPAETPPEEIFPRREIQRDYRLSARFPGLSRVGRYTVVWEHPTVPSRSAPVKVIRAYHADRAYLADVRTSMGKFSIEFFPSVAPKNVKNFIDLANSGFYDRMQFHMIIPGILIQAGDSKGDGNGYPGYRVPPEFSRIRHLKGTVSMWHHHTTVDSGSQFFVCLSDQSQFNGNYTVIGQVKSGLDVVEKIGQVPTTEDRGRRPFLPLQGVTIQGIRIKER